MPIISTISFTMPNEHLLFFTPFFLSFSSYRRRFPALVAAPPPSSSINNPLSDVHYVVKFRLELIHPLSPFQAHLVLLPASLTTTATSINYLDRTDKYPYSFRFSSSRYPKMDYGDKTIVTSSIGYTHCCGPLHKFVSSPPLSFPLKKKKKEKLLLIYYIAQRKTRFILYTSPKAKKLY